MNNTGVKSSENRCKLVSKRSKYILKKPGRKITLPARLFMLNLIFMNASYSHFEASPYIAEASRLLLERELDTVDQFFAAHQE